MDLQKEEVSRAGGLAGMRAVNVKPKLCPPKKLAEHYCQLKV